MNVNDDALSHAIRSMYEVISFEEGGEPDWERMKTIFLPNARITRLTPEGIDYFDLPTFQAMAQEMLDCGIYTAFHEQEIARRSTTFGMLAHVLSAYETKRTSEAIGFLARGVNSIQLLQVQGTWRIHSLLWDEEAKDNLINLREMFPSEVLHG